MKRHPAALTQGPIFRTLVVFSLPILFGNVLQSLSGSVNSVWIGRYLGEAALTASANANSVLFLLIGSIFGFSMAATIAIAQHVGAQRIAEARRVVGTSAVFFLALSVTIGALGYAFAPLLLRWMHTPDDALPYAIAYLRMLFAGLPFLFMIAFLMAVLRGAGDSKTPFKFLLLAVGLDIALNPLLIFGWGPLPALGIAGSALATAIGNAVSLAALLAYLYRRDHELCLRGADLAQLRIDPVVVRTLLAKGVPMGLQMIVISASGLLMITLVNRFGTDTTAAYGAAMQLWNYVQMPAMAIGAAASSMAAQNVGANRWDRVHQVAKSAVGFSLLLTGSLVALLYLFEREALGLFLREGAAVGIGLHIHAICTWSFVLFGVPMAVFGVVRATGAVMPPLITLFVALWLVRFPFAELMLPYWGADAIWWSYPLSAATATVLALAYYKWGGWRRARIAPVVPVPVSEPAG